jgi:hypothetical protein
MSAVYHGLPRAVIRLVFAGIFKPVRTQFQGGARRIDY